MSGNGYHVTTEEELRVFMEVGHISFSDEDKLARFHAVHGGACSFKIKIKAGADEAWTYLAHAIRLAKPPIRELSWTSDRAVLAARGKWYGHAECFYIKDTTVPNSFATVAILTARAGRIEIIEHSARPTPQKPKFLERGARFYATDDHILAKLRLYEGMFEASAEHGRTED